YLPGSEPLSLGMFTPLTGKSIEPILTFPVPMAAFRRWPTPPSRQKRVGYLVNPLLPWGVVRHRADHADDRVRRCQGDQLLEPPVGHQDVVVEPYQELTPGAAQAFGAR